MAFPCTWNLELQLSWKSWNRGKHAKKQRFQSARVHVLLRFNDPRTKIW